VGYRVLSLDLHDTVVWDTRAIVEAQYDVRWSLLGQGLLMSDGSPIPSEDLRRAREALLSEWKSEGRRAASVPVATQVDRIRQILGAQYAGPVEQVVQRYAEGGLKEHPPVVNPEAKALVRHLNEVGFPVVMITDTNRSDVAGPLGASVSPQTPLSHPGRSNLRSCTNGQGYGTVLANPTHKFSPRQ